MLSVFFLGRVATGFEDTARGVTGYEVLSNLRFVHLDAGKAVVFFLFSYYFMLNR